MKKLGFKKILPQKIVFLSGLIGKFHINFTVDIVFEKLVSTKTVQWYFQWFISITTSLNYLVGTRKGHKKQSRAFQLII